MPVFRKCAGLKICSSHVEQKKPAVHAVSAGRAMSGSGWPNARMHGRGLQISP
ncbi:hypothetical protein SXCC_02047 [Gluconacetobacter sp. SXCC-1]|nr:hypothetical protein SXCC_02047 [Gluconacetobacter sp. SXCC-1]